MRGRIAHQNAKDEPASLLLERLQAEKQRLIREGEFRRTKQLPVVKRSEAPWRLPKGWIWTRLGDVTNYGSTKKAKAGDLADDTWVLDLGDIEKTSSKLLKRIRFRERHFKSSKNAFQAGDVLYGKLRPYLA